MNYAPRSRVWAVAAPTTLCVSRESMRDHLRVTDTTEDAAIDGFIGAAQRTVERQTQRLLTRRAVTLKLPGLPAGSCPVELPGGEVGTIASVTADGVAVTGAQAFGDSPAVLLPAADWPTVTGTVYPVEIVYQAGFAECPADLKAAVKLIAAELFWRRTNAEEGSLAEVPVSAQSLIAPWRIRPV
jgi:uncharacterized phiE125 gp8 family phage protein